MKEDMYGVTPSILYEIAQYAVEHPEKHFCADELTDGDGDFLSCFFLEDDRDGYPIWELDDVTTCKGKLLDAGITKQISEDFYDELCELLTDFKNASDDYNDDDYLSDGEWLDVFYDFCVRLKNRLN